MDAESVGEFQNFARAISNSPCPGMARTMFSRLSKTHFGDAERVYRSMKVAIAIAIAILARATNHDLYANPKIGPTIKSTKQGTAK